MLQHKVILSSLEINLCIQHQKQVQCTFTNMLNVYTLVCSVNVHVLFITRNCMHRFFVHKNDTKYVFDTILHPPRRQIHCKLQSPENKTINNTLSLSLFHECGSHGFVMLKWASAKTVTVPKTLNLISAFYAVVSLTHKIHLFSTSAVFLNSVH